MFPYWPWKKHINIACYSMFYPGIRGKCITAAKGLKVFLNPSLPVAKCFFFRLNYLIVVRECLDLSEIRKSLLKL